MNFSTESDTQVKKKNVCAVVSLVVDMWWIVQQLFYVHKKRQYVSVKTFTQLVD